MGREFLDRVRAHAGSAVTGTAVLDSLTGREREVLGLVARGLSNAEIAGRLCLSEGTVKTYVSRVLAELGLRNRVQAGHLRLRVRTGPRGSH